MGFAQWFWRLFLVFAGLIIAHVLIVTLLVQQAARSAATDIPLWPLWLAGGVVIACGLLATWYCVRRIVEPLAELSRRVRNVATGIADQATPTSRDELGVLT